MAGHSINAVPTFSMASSCTGATVTRKTSPPGQVRTMALCPHKARLLVGIEIWPLAGKGLQGECMYVLLGCGLESPVWALRDLNSESGTRHKKGTWREMGAEGCGGYLWKGGWF